MRTGFDAIDVNNLPPGGDVYLGYDDGTWPDAGAIAARFPGKTVIRITVNPAHNYGIIGDGPPDNGTWPQWVAWVVMRRHAGADPWINTNASNWQGGRDAFAAAKVPEPHWWIAHYDNDPTIPAGALMKQYASNAKYDTSSCAPYLPGIDPAPKPVPPPVPRPIPQLEENTMHLIDAPRTAASGSPRDIFVLNGPQYDHVPTPALYAKLLKLAGETQAEVVDCPTHEWLLATYHGTPVTG